MYDHDKMCVSALKIVICTRQIENQKRKCKNRSNIESTVMCVVPHLTFVDIGNTNGFVKLSSERLDCISQSWQTVATRIVA